MDNISGTLINFNYYHIILGADFNACVHPELDRSCTDSTVATSSSVALNSLIAELNLANPWGIKNGNTKAYTFYSTCHKSFSRIDYILVDPFLVQYISNIDVLISDNSPVICNITTGAKVSKFYWWRFNNTLLYDISFLEQYKQELKIVLEINSHCHNPPMLWEVTKVFLRGNCISCFTIGTIYWQFDSLWPDWLLEGPFSIR